MAFAMVFTGVSNAWVKNANFTVNFLCLKDYVHITGMDIAKNLAHLIAMVRT